MLYRYALILAAVLLPSLALAQKDGSAEDPELVVNEPAELAFTFNNFIPYASIPAPYVAPDSTTDLIVGYSLFFELDTTQVPIDSIDTGVEYTREGVTGDLSLTTAADRGNALRGCNTLAEDLTDQIAFIQRGDCNFTTKAAWAEIAGAMGVVIFNNPASPAVGGMLAGDSLNNGLFGIPSISIPVVLIGDELANPILAALDNGDVVNVTIRCAGPAEDEQCAAVAAEPGPSPTTFGLTAAAPNPFSATTTLKLTLAQPQEVRVEVFNALGQRVAVLHDGALASGVEHALTLDGRALPSGVYLVRATGEGVFAAQQVALTR